MLVKIYADLELFLRIADAAYSVRMLNVSHRIKFIATLLIPTPALICNLWLRAVTSVTTLKRTVKDADQRVIKSDILGADKCLSLAFGFSGDLRLP